MTAFFPTHTITHDGTAFAVQCEPVFDDGDDTGWMACFTEGEAATLDAADWEYCPATGELVFQGQPPRGEWSIDETTA